jgi:hypothetical protein
VDLRVGGQHGSAGALFRSAFEDFVFGPHLHELAAQSELCLQFPQDGVAMSDHEVPGLFEHPEQRQRLCCVVTATLQFGNAISLLGNASLRVALVPVCLQ